jgi:hypothetical protein
VLLLDYPLVSMMTLGSDGSYPHLVVIAKRQLPDASLDNIVWFGKCSEGC